MTDNTNQDFGSGPYKSSSNLFRSLTTEEVNEFREHARENYIPNSPINDVWHPVYRFECLKMNAEAKDKLVYKWEAMQRNINS